METWQIIISICAGAITLITFAEKIGFTRTAKDIKSDHRHLIDLISVVDRIDEATHNSNVVQDAQNQAILSILRNILYTSFRTNRHLAIWTDDECRVQTLLHDAYRSLGGNGEEDIWWEKKKTWKIVTQEEYDVILQKTMSRRATDNPKVVSVLK